ncbi:hypothetical protein, partial [Rhodococcus triatomae]
FQFRPIGFGTANDISQPFHDCTLNVSWPVRHSSTYWVGSGVDAQCTNPKRRTEAIANWFFTPSGGNEQTAHRYTQAATQPPNNVHEFEGELVASCRNGTWRARVDFNITNADGGIMSTRHRTDPVAISGCMSQPPVCPSSMSQADCNAAAETYVFAVQHNLAARPGYAGHSQFDNDLGHLPDPVD